MGTTLLGVAFVLAAPLVARGDVFAFKDRAGYEACLRIDHVVEKVTTPTGAQLRVLDRDEIRTRCAAAAVKLVTPTRNHALAIDLVRSTRRLAGPGYAIGLVGFATRTVRSTCNEIALYEVLTFALSGPATDPMVTEARPIVKHCLGDATFRVDFLDERNAEDPFLAANACRLLREEKLVKSCPVKP